MCSIQWNLRAIRYKRKAFNYWNQDVFFCDLHRQCIPWTKGDVGHVETQQIKRFNRSDEGLTLETSAFLPSTVANLRFQLSC